MVLLRTRYTKALTDKNGQGVLLQLRKSFYQVEHKQNICANFVAGRFMKVFSLLITLCFITLAAKAQEEPKFSEVLHGVWVVPESIITTEIESPENTSYFRYFFMPDSTVYFSSHEYEMGAPSPYRVDGSKVKMFGYNYVITNYAADIIMLKANLPFQQEPHMISLMRQHVYDSIVKGYRASERRNDKWRAVFHGNYHLQPYIFSTGLSPSEYRRALEFPEIDPIQTPPQSDKLIRLKFVVDQASNVTVLDVSGVPELTRRKREHLREKMEKTSGEWIQARYRGEKVSDTLDLVFAQRGKSSVAFRLRVERLHQSAEDYFKREKYESAIITISKAINLDPYNYQFYVLRANSHFQLNNMDRYCADMSKAHSLNPTLKPEKVKVIRGEMVNVDCH